MKKEKNSIMGAIFAIVIIIALGTWLYNRFNDLFYPEPNYVDFSQYQKLNEQSLHQDYIDNEISAKEKYNGQYFYFSGKISNIAEVLNDNYLEINYPYEKDPTKKIQLTAYFVKGSEELKTVKKEDDVTVYCKFKQRSIKDYGGIITSYSFDSCRLKN